MSYSDGLIEETPILGLKIVTLDGDEIDKEMDMSISSDGLLIGVLDGVSYLLGVPVSYNKASGTVLYQFLSDGSTLTYRQTAPTADKGLVIQFHDAVNAFMQWIFNSRNGGSTDTITLQVISTAGAASNAFQISRSTGRVTAPHPFRFVPQATPSNPLNGMVYYDSTSHKLRQYSNGAWVDLH